MQGACWCGLAVLTAEVPRCLRLWVALERRVLGALLAASCALCGSGCQTAGAMGRHPCAERCCPICCRASCIVTLQWLLTAAVCCDFML